MKIYVDKQQIIKMNFQITIEIIGRFNELIKIYGYDLVNQYVNLINIQTYQTYKNLTKYCQSLIEKSNEYRI